MKGHKTQFQDWIKIAVEGKVALLQWNNGKELPRTFGWYLAKGSLACKVKMKRISKHVPRIDEKTKRVILSADFYSAVDLANKCKRLRNVH